MISKAEQLASEWGYNFLDEVLQDSDLMFDCISPGICMNHYCNYTTEVEPDCATGYCEECQTQTVHSIHILLGVI